MASDDRPNRSGEIYRAIASVIKLDGPSLTVSFGQDDQTLIIEYWYDGVRVNKPFNVYMFDLNPSEYINEFTYNLIVDWAMLRLME